MKPRLTRERKLSRLISDFDGNPDFQIYGEPVRNTTILNLLPEIGSDLNAYANELVLADFAKPVSKNMKIDNHYLNLQYEFRGKPAIMPLLALCISYLRRGTIYDDQAIWVFFHILNNHWETVKPHITARWVLACLRTIVEYGSLESEQNLALSGYVYGTLIRNYETERKFDGLPSEELTFDLPQEGQSTGVPNLGRYVMGRDNGASIINVLMIQAAANDSVVGEMILCMMSDIKHGKTIFSRVDDNISQHEDSHNRPCIWGFGPKQDDELIGTDVIKYDIHDL